MKIEEIKISYDNAVPKPLKFLVSDGKMMKNIIENLNMI